MNGGSELDVSGSEGRFVVERLFAMYLLASVSSNNFSHNVSGRDEPDQRAKTHSETVSGVKRRELTTSRSQRNGAIDPAS